jgi:hypothetical protein
MSRSIAATVFVLSLLFAGLAIPSLAEACSCAGPRNYKDVEPYYAEAIGRSDAAIVGVVKDVRLVDDSPDDAQGGGDEQHVFTFRVRNNYKGPGLAPRGGTIEIWTSAYGASCGLELEVGERTGLLIDKRRGKLTSLLCWQAKPGWIKRGAAAVETKAFSDQAWRRTRGAQCGGAT